MICTSDSKTAGVLSPFPGSIRPLHLSAVLQSFFKSGAEKEINKHINRSLYLHFRDLRIPSELEQKKEIIYFFFLVNFSSLVCFLKEPQTESHETKTGEQQL